MTEFRINGPSIYLYLIKCTMMLVNHNTD